MFEDNRYENNSNQTGNNYTESNYQNDNYNNYSQQTPNQGDFQPQDYTPNLSTGAVNSYEWGTDKKEAVPNKKEKKPVSRGAVALILVLTVICSGVLGVCGGVGTYYIMGKQNAKTDKGLSVYKTDVTGGADESAVALSTEEISNKVADSVVEIVTETVSYSMFYGQAVAEGAGSGVIIDSDGYIVTNHHVIENANKIKVKLRNGNEYEAKLIGSDSDKDVALIKINPKSDEHLTIAVLGDSDKLAVGDKAVVIGNPLGQLGGTVTDGIISALDRHVQFEDKTMNLMQTDAAINPGNSGGGLFDGQGNLVGIIVAKANNTGSTSSIEGLGFAIPINDAQSILGDLKNYGYVKGKPAEIGVVLQDYMDMVYIYSVTENSPADKAGLQKGDKIMSIDGDSVKTSSDFKSKVTESKAGDKLKFEIERNGETKTISVTIEEASKEEQQPTTENQSYIINDDDINSIWDDFGF